MTWVYFNLHFISLLCFFDSLLWSHNVRIFERYPCARDYVSLVFFFFFFSFFFLLGFLLSICFFHFISSSFFPLFVVCIFSARSRRRLKMIWWTVLTSFSRGRCVNPHNNWTICSNDSLQLYQVTSFLLSLSLLSFCPLSLIVVFTVPLFVITPCHPSLSYSYFSLTSNEGYYFPPFLEILLVPSALPLSFLFFLFRKSHPLFCWFQFDVEKVRKLVAPRGQTFKQEENWESIDRCGGSPKRKTQSGAMLKKP